jgi:cobalt-zinc-cadmium efflux system membrane fusion protein
MLTLAAACQRAASEVAAKSPDRVTTAEPTAEAVELDPEQVANVRTETVHEQVLHRLLTATGKVQWNEDRTTRILAPIPGQVMDLHVRVGDPIRKDQVLFFIRSREVAAMVTDYFESQRDFDLVTKTHHMTKDLFEHQAASKVALQQAEGDLAKAAARLGRAEEALRVLGLNPQEIDRSGELRSLIPVVAPVGGTVIERTVTAGQYVQADSAALLTIADLSMVWVMVDVFENDIRGVHPGGKVQITAAAYPDLRFKAIVDRISDKVDPETRTLKVRLLVANPSGLLKSEMFITASLELSDTTAGATVPAKAVLTEDDKSYLFVAAGGRRFERRLVAAASDGTGRLRVTSGLRTGERVVTDGALLLNFRRKQGQQ